MWGGWRRRPIPRFLLCWDMEVNEGVRERREGGKGEEVRIW